MPRRISLAARDALTRSSCRVSRIAMLAVASLANPLAAQAPPAGAQPAIAPSPTAAPAAQSAPTPAVGASAPRTGNGTATGTATATPGAAADSAPETVAPGPTALDALPELPPFTFVGIDEFPDNGLSPGQNITSTTYELDEIYTPHKGTFELGGVEAPLDWLVQELQKLEAATGLRLGMAYTMLFQQASGGPGDRTGAAGDLDLMASWTLLGRGSQDTGRFVFAGEYRHAIGDQPPSALGGVLGTLTNTTGGFNDRGWVVRDAYWLQSLCENRVRFLAGRADPSDFVGGHRLQGINSFFSNRAFSANAAVAFPNGHGPTAGVSVVPTDQFFVTAGASNAYSRPTTWNIESLVDEWRLFYFGEFGFTPTIEGLGPGRYRLMLWHMDSRPEDNLPSDEGLSVILEQDLGTSYQVFGRYSYSAGDLTNIRNTSQVGGAIRGLLGSPQNITGLAGSWSEPAREGRDEWVVELFHRWQVTRHTQFSVGIQGIFDPTNSPDVDAIAVFTARFRIAF